MQSMNAQDPLVHLSLRIPVSDWQRLLELAKSREMILGEHYNISGASRMALTLGLDAVEMEAQEAQEMTT